MQRSPSNFGSNNQSGSEKRSSVSVAAIGAIQRGMRRVFAFARASAGRDDNTRLTDVS